MYWAYAREETAALELRNVYVRSPRSVRTLGATNTRSLNSIPLNSIEKSQKLRTISKTYSVFVKISKTIQKTRVEAMYNDGIFMQVVYAVFFL